jgi:hypothetical protein
MTQCQLSPHAQQLFTFLEQQQQLLLVLLLAISEIW